MPGEIRFAIIGTGMIGKTHAEQLDQIENARLVAVAGTNQQKTETFARTYGADAYTDYRVMLQREDIDIVAIATPSGLHADMAIAAAEQGKHVLVEKPIDVTLQKAQAMIQACKRAGVKLGVLFQHRFDTSSQQLDQMLQNGQLGDLVLGNMSMMWYRNQAYYDSAKWRGTWALDGGGALMNQGIHSVDLLQHFMGPVESVYAHTATSTHERIEVEDVAVATLKFKNGAIGTLVGTTSAYPGYSNRLDIVGTRGSAVIENDDLAHLHLLGEEERNQHSAADAERNDSANAASSAAVAGITHRAAFLDMIEAVQQDREPLVTGEEGLKSLQVILAIYESARSGQPVRVEE